MDRPLFVAIIAALIVSLASSVPSGIECPSARLYGEAVERTANPSDSEKVDGGVSAEIPPPPPLAGGVSTEISPPPVAGLTDNGGNLEELVVSEVESASLINKGKREICEQLLKQIQDLPCDNPVVVTCGNSLPRPYFPCSDAGSSRESSDPEEIPSDNFQDSSGPPPPPSPQGVSQKDKGLFEGLLRFATVVNHIDTFITEKGKGLIRGLNRMVESEENASF